MTTKERDCNLVHQQRSSSDKDAHHHHHHHQQPSPSASNDNSDNNNNNKDDDDDADDAAHTFRKRRLSLPNLRQLLQQQQQQQQQEEEEKGVEAAGTPREEQEEKEMLGYELDSGEAEHDDDDDDEQQQQQQHNSQHQHHHHPVSEQEQDEKAHTFRKRRLSLTSSNSNHSHAAAAVDDDDHHPADSPVAAEAAAKRQRRRSSADSLASIGSSSSHADNSSVVPQDDAAAAFRSRTVHAGELLGRGDRPPPSPALHASSVLYQQSPLPPPSLMLLPPPPRGVDDGGDHPSHPSPSTLANATTTTTAPASLQRRGHFPSSAHHPQQHQPKWKRRQTIDPHTENHKLPFDRDVVGTYSCHGVEPVYEEEEGDGDDGDEYYIGGDDNVGDEPQQIQQDTREAFPDSHPYLEDIHNNNDDNPNEEEEEEEEEDGKREARSSEPNEHPQQQHDPSEQQQQQQESAPPVTVAKINQDRGGVVFPYGNCAKTALFAVYDGHGQGGELVSQYALHEIQRRLERHPAFGTDLATALKETFLTVDEQLKDEPLIEPLFCGTTACVAVLRDQALTLANCGDSRAVCARRVKQGTTTCSDSSHADHQHAPPSWLALDLTADQNPDVPAELERIVAAGGHITLPPAPGLSARVWLDPDCTQIGLAMARSIGDHAVASVGVIAEPEITTHRVAPEDEFLILASDGVWEFIESLEAVHIVGAHLGERGSATKACQALIEAAAARWHEEEGLYRDDITAIVVRLPELWKRSSQPALSTSTSKRKATSATAVSSGTTPATKGNKEP